MQQTPLDQVDLLHQVEKITETASKNMNRKSRSVLRRYPILFTLLIVFGVIAIDEGVKGIFDEFGFNTHPGYLFLGGIIVLLLTGTLFKKLDSFHVEK